LYQGMALAVPSRIEKYWALAPANGDPSRDVHPKNILRSARMSFAALAIRAAGAKALDRGHSGGTAEAVP
jgi:hypothetical protein